MHKGSVVIIVLVVTGTTAATGGSSFTDAGRHDTPVERSAVGFTDEAAPTTAAQTSKHAPSFGTTAHEHASAPGNVSNAGLDTGILALLLQCTLL